ncbi:MAG TPA: hypothetical protein VLM40_22080 [Gemmata sp.]|nr:hypothetical protein [Gemmata sp.]
MKRAMPLTVIGLLLVATTGCSSSPESLIKQSIADMNALADALEKKEPLDKIQAAADRVKASQEKLRTKKMSSEEKKRLEELYKNSEKEALKRMTIAAAGYPEGMKIVNEMMKSIK